MESLSATDFKNYDIQVKAWRKDAILIKKNTLKAPDKIAARKGYNKLETQCRKSLHG